MTTKLDLAAELQLAAQAVRAAATVTRSVQRDLVNAATLEKKDKSPVTVADFASQAVVCGALNGASAVAHCVGEEDAADLRGEDAAERRAKVVAHVESVRGQSLGDDAVLAMIDLGGHTPTSADARYWTLDPIDGTKGFLRAEHYAIALGLIVEGEVVVAALGCPKMMVGTEEGALLTAVRGQGAMIAPLYADGAATRVHVSDVSDVSAARFCESVESGHSDQSQSAQIARELGIDAPPLRMDSQAKYAGVARGDASIYLRLPTRKDYREKIWDHAAGLLVVEEAGGKVTDVRGDALDFSLGRTLENNRGVIATNGHIHDAVLAAVSNHVTITE